MSKVAKIAVNDEIRRIRLEDSPQSQLTVVSFKALVRSLFESLPRSFSLFYTDEDGDLIAVREDRELIEAFEMAPTRSGAKVVRFSVKETSADEKLAAVGGTSTGPAPSVAEVNENNVGDQEQQQQSSSSDETVNADNLGAESLVSNVVSLLNQFGLSEVAEQVPAFAENLGPNIQSLVANAVEAAEKAAEQAALAQAYASEQAEQQNKRFATENRKTWKKAPADEKRPASAPLSSASNEAADDDEFEISVETLIGEHIPVRVRASDSVESVKAKVAAMRHFATCDGCEKTIYGVRYRCTSCSDFDFCAKCIASEHSHDPSHRFRAIVKPQTATSTSEAAAAPSSPVTHNAICDHCQERVVGIRYKCGNCRDFDLCSGCFEANEHEHDESHAFLALRRLTPAPFMVPLLRRNLFTGENSGMNARRCPALGPVHFGPHGGMPFFGCGPVAPLPPPPPPVVIDLSSAPGGPPMQSAPESRPRFCRRYHHHPRAQAQQQQTGAAASTERVAPVPCRRRRKQQQQQPQQQQPQQQEVTPPAPLTAGLVAHVTVPPGTLIVGGSPFVKIFRLKNTSAERSWPAGARLLHVGGDNIGAGARSAPLLQAVGPGEAVDVAIDCSAPAEPGHYEGHWTVLFPDKSRAGEFVISIEVPRLLDSSSTKPAPSSDSELSLRSSTGFVKIEDVNDDDDDDAADEEEVLVEEAKEAVESSDDSPLAKLVAMGFDESAARVALSFTKNNIVEAMTMLIDSSN